MSNPYSVLIKKTFPSIGVSAVNFELPIPIGKYRSSKGTVEQPGVQRQSSKWEQAPFILIKQSNPLPCKFENNTLVADANRISLFA